MSLPPESQSDSANDKVDLDEEEWVWTSPPLQTTPTDLTKQIINFEKSATHCPLCHAFFNIPVTLRPCNHVFCSECIRNSLTAVNKIRRCRTCPLCSTEVKGREEDYLVPNWGLTVVIKEYKELRRVLHSHLVDCQQQKREAICDSMNMNAANNNSTNSSGTSGIDNGNVEKNQEKELNETTFNENCQNTHSKRPRRNCQKKNDPNYNEDQSFDHEIETVNQPPERASPLQPPNNQIKNTSTTTMITNNNKNNIPCNISDTNINNLNNITNIPITNQSNMKRIPPFRFHGTKKTQLIQWCQKHGLSPDGSDDDRKWRLKNFAVLWNAECDAMIPRSKEELVMALKVRERCEKVCVVPHFQYVLLFVSYMMIMYFKVSNDILFFVINILDRMQRDNSIAMTNSILKS